MREIRVLLADDHAPFREGLRAILDRRSDMVVVGEAKDGVEATERVSELAPDVVLMDIHMPLRDGIEATRLIAVQNPQVVVIIFTMYVDPTYVLEAVKAGAWGYILKSTKGQELIEAIRTVYQGGSVLDPGATKTVLQEFRRLAEDS